MEYKDSDARLMEGLNRLIKWSVRLLAILMVFVIIMGVVDVGWTLYEKLMAAPKFILTISDMLATFGAFMAVLIAIEIFINITIYLRDNVIHVKIVIATALMAIARKVIILDLETTPAEYLWGMALIVVAMSVAYWVVQRYGSEEGSHWVTAPVRGANPAYIFTISNVIGLRQLY